LGFANAYFAEEVGEQAVPDGKYPLGQLPPLVLENADACGAGFLHWA